MFDRYIQEIPVISKEVCSSLIAEASERGNWAQAMVFHRSEGQDMLISTDYRSNDSVVITPDYADYDTVVEGLHSAYRQYSERVLADIPSDSLRNPMPMSENSICTLEAIQLLRYGVGQLYDWHSDQVLESGTFGHGRTMSVVLYLNDDFEGGFTEFVDKPRKAKPGEALFFPSCWTYAHTATPVKEGTKYAIATWYHISRN